MFKKEFPTFIPLYEIIENEVCTLAEKYCWVDLENSVVVLELNERFSKLMDEFKVNNYEEKLKNTLVRWSIFNNKNKKDNFFVKRDKSLNYLITLLNKDFELEELK